MKVIQELVVWLSVLVGVITPTPTPQFVQPTGVALPGVGLSVPGVRGLVKLPVQEYQSFNNCGPTTLAMVLRWAGKDVTGTELGKVMRPYQHPKGDNDDKTVFAEEYARHARGYGMGAVVRVGGSVEMLKRLVANGFPVTVKTLLHSNDDIAHFRIVTGWDDAKQIIIQNDSYEGKNKQFKYSEWLSEWQPYNYVYIVVYQPDQEAKVKAILGEEWEEEGAWQRAYDRATQEARLNPGLIYPVFNQVTSLYHLGRFDESVRLFETIESDLPRRTLWYQIEPIEAYLALGEYQKVLTITEKVLQDNNRAYSELYLQRGKAYEKLGQLEAAKREYGLALKYNQNLPEAVEINNRH